MPPVTTDDALDRLMAEMPDTAEVIERLLTDLPDADALDRIFADMAAPPLDRLWNEIRLRYDPTTRPH